MKDRITAHYTHGQLLDRILSGVEAIGKTPDTVTVDELAPADEFHIGGRQASSEQGAHSTGTARGESCRGRRSHSRIFCADWVI